MQRFITYTLSTIVLATTSLSFAADTNSNHKIFTPNDIQWSTNIDSLPKGVEVAVLEGDPSKTGPFTLRLKMPANYRIPPHWHPGIEHVTVLSGTFYMGTGDKFDEKQVMEMPTDSFAYMRAKTYHFAFTHDPVILQLHGIGPWGVTYLNPQDDPRNVKK